MTMGSALLTAAEMAQADALTVLSGLSTLELMRSAGRAVADAAQRISPEGQILVIAGRGNNGGDGFVAASVLADRGRDVAVMLFCRRESLKGDAATVAAEWRGPLLPFEASGIGRPALITDALFGAGLNRPLKGEPLAMIAAMNASGIPVLSIDLPSGIDADSGAVMGDAVQATETITFFRRKVGHLLLPGRIRCGRLHVAQIGIQDDVLARIGPRTFGNGPQLWASHFPVPKIDGHKYTRGHALVVSGGPDATGAARLTARAALRAGSGLVTVASPDEALAINSAALTAVMVRAVNSPVELRNMLADKRLSAVAIGPGAGVGARTRAMVIHAIEAGSKVVLDADALTSFADDPDELFEALRLCTLPAVLTPHQGEFIRLFNALDSDSKLESARRAARKASAVIVLKGPDTVVASPDGRAAIADNAPPWLATAGSGDALTGMIAGMLAQHVPPFEAACIGVWLHGEAGQEAGPGLIAEDLPEAIPAIYRRLFKELANGSYISTR